MTKKSSIAFLRDFLGKPIWGAKKGHGSFLTFNLGEPRIDVEEPKIHLFLDSVKRQILAQAVLQMQNLSQVNFSLS